MAFIWLGTDEFRNRHCCGTPSEIALLPLYQRKLRHWGWCLLIAITKPKI